jgi:hypothetical protein
MLPGVSADAAQVGLFADSLDRPVSADNAQSAVLGRVL